MRLFLNTTIAKKAVVSIFDKDKIIAQEEAQEPLIAIDKLLQKHKFKLKDFKEIDYHPGPGSFTGLRIGSAVAQALNFALGRKVKRKELKYR